MDKKEGIEMTKITRKEYQKLEEMFSLLSQNEGMLDEELKARFPGDADAIRKDLETGVDLFYASYAKDMTSQDIAHTLTQRLSALTLREKYTALCNILLALTHMNNTIADNAQWTSAAEEYSTILKALDLGMIEKTDAELQQDVADMTDLIARDVEASAVLLLGDAPYHKLFETCMNGENPAAVEALAINTREAAVNMAGAMYLLQADGALPSLGADKIPAQDMGVAAATIVEVDAAYKSGSWEKAKAVLEKASKAGISLLISSPDLLKNLTFFSLVALLTGLNTFWMLVAGAIMLVNMKLHSDKASAYADKIYKLGAKFVGVALDKTKLVAGKVNGWLQVEVYPRAKKVWAACTDFAVNRILVPTATLILKAKQRLTSWTKAMFDKVASFLARVKASVRARTEAAASEEQEVEEDIFDDYIEEPDETEDYEETASSFEEDEGDLDA